MRVSALAFFATSPSPAAGVSLRCPLGRQSLWDYATRQPPRVSHSRISAYNFTSCALAEKMSLSKE